MPCAVAQARGRAVRGARYPVDDLPPVGTAASMPCPARLHPAGGSLSEGLADPVGRELLGVGLGDENAAGLFARFQRRDWTVVGSSTGGRRPCMGA